MQQELRRVVVWQPPGRTGPVSEAVEARRMGDRSVRRPVGSDRDSGRSDSSSPETGGADLWGWAPWGWEAAPVEQPGDSRTIGRDWLPARPPKRTKRREQEGSAAEADTGGRPADGAVALAPAVAPLAPAVAPAWREGAGVGPYRGAAKRGKALPASWTAHAGENRGWAIPENLGGQSPEKRADGDPAEGRGVRMVYRDSFANLFGLLGPRQEIRLPDIVGQATSPEELYLPPEIEAMAQDVMRGYDMSVAGMRLITTKPDKGGAIWRIETNRGPRSLKLLHRPPARSLFSVGLQEYLAGQGGRVPGLVRSLLGEPYKVIDGRMWIVTDWIEPLTPAAKTGLEGARQLCHGLGEFHAKSRGYVPPTKAVLASRLYRWPQAYRKVLTKIGWFRVLAEAYREMPASPTVLSVVDRFEAQARRAVEALDASPYARLAALGEPHWGVVHQD